MQKNLYLAHCLLRCIGKTGTGCYLVRHAQFVATEWEYCTLQDVDRAVALLQQGIDPERVDQQLWNDACNEQDVYGTQRFYQQTPCCNACALLLLIGHLNDKRLARSTLVTAQKHQDAVLLLSDRADKRPLVAANIPLNIRVGDIGPLLRVKLATT
jgi:hypothetical protein